MSLVLVSPSMLMRLKLRLTACVNGLEKRLTDEACVGDEHAEQCRHVRVDHAGAFAAMPVKRTSCPATEAMCVKELGPRPVGGHDGTGSVRLAVRTQRRRDREDRRQQFVHRQLHADDAGAHHKNGVVARLLLVRRNLRWPVRWRRLAPVQALAQPLLMITP